MIEVKCVTSENQIINNAIDFIWGYWGDNLNYDFYADCIRGFATSGY